MTLMQAAFALVVSGCFLAAYDDRRWLTTLRLKFDAWRTRRRELKEIARIDRIPPKNSYDRRRYRR